MEPSRPDRRRSMSARGPSRNVGGLAVPMPGWLSRFADVHPCDPDDPANWTRIDRFHRIVRVQMKPEWLSDERHLRNETFRDEELDTFTQKATAFAEHALGVKTALFESSFGGRTERTRSRERSRSVERSLMLQFWVHDAFRSWQQRTARFSVERNRCCPAAIVEPRYQFAVARLHAAALVRPGFVPAESATEDPRHVCRRIDRPFDGCVRCRYRLEPFTTHHVVQQRYKWVNPVDGHVWHEGDTLWEDA